MEIGIEYCTRLIMKSRDRETIEAIKLTNRNEYERLERRKMKSAWEYWKRTLAKIIEKRKKKNKQANKRRWKKKEEKSTSE